MSEELTEVRVIHGTHGRVEDDEQVFYNTGDTFEATEAELRAFGDKLKPTEVSSANGAKKKLKTVLIGDTPLESVSVTVAMKAIEGGNYDLSAMLLAERNGRGRRTLIQYLEKSISEQQ